MYLILTVSYFAGGVYFLFKHIGILSGMLFALSLLMAASTVTLKLVEGHVKKVLNESKDILSVLENSLKTASSMNDIKKPE
jgi:hypothetical protein